MTDETVTRVPTRCPVCGEAGHDTNSYGGFTFLLCPEVEPGSLWVVPSWLKGALRRDGGDDL